MNLKRYSEGSKLKLKMKIKEEVRSLNKSPVLKGYLSEFTYLDLDLRRKVRVKDTWILLL